jgi:L-lactate utilization protein LutC
MMASGQTQLARIGRTTDVIAGAATRVRLARASSATIKVEIIRGKVEITRAATGTKKAADAAVVGAVAGIAKTGVIAVVVEISNASTSL